jgi:glycosyltransferase involved in cell wall biosynthesis
LISVIICTYKRAHLLKRVLQSLCCQTIPVDQFEVIVVDDGSRDKTGEIWALFRQQLPSLRYVNTEENHGLGSALNVGIIAATGEYLLFTDDDCIPQNDWIECMHTALQDEPIVAGSVASLTDSYFKLCHNIATFHQVMPGQQAGFVELLAGANMGMHRTVFKTVGMFQEGRRTASDMEWTLRARAKGYRIYLASDAVVMHDPERTTFATLVKYAVKHASVTILLRQQYRALLQTPFVLRSPGILLCCAPLIALKVTLDTYLGNARLIKFWRTAPVTYLLRIAWCWGAIAGLREKTDDMNLGCEGKSC